MRNGEKLSLEQIRAFLEASAEVEFAAKNRQEVYDWMSRTLGEHGYGKQSRAVKGLLRAYLMKMTGLSRAQVTRLFLLRANLNENATFSVSVHYNR